MNYIKAGLLDSVVGTYDQTKTTIKGNVFSKTISGVPYLGPSLNKFLDVFSDVGLTVFGVVATGNGRVFVITPEVGTTVTIALYNFNYSNGTHSYVGKITAHLAEAATTTHTMRSFKIIDTGTTGWKIFITTSANVAINGGVFLVNKVDLADFTTGGTDFPFATGNDQKASYFLQDPSAIGVGQLNVSAQGAVLHAADNKLYVRNGSATVYQYYVYDTSVAPTYTTASVDVSVASPGKVSYTSHPFAVNDPVVFSSGPLPTGLTVGTVYFVRNPGANDFELSATSGGASINTTGSPAVGVSIGRAFGTTGSNWLFKTGNLPATTGTLVGNDSDDLATPAHGTNSGFACAFFITSTSMYLGRLSELTAGVTTWPSLVSANMADTGSGTVLQTARAASWSTLLDRAVMNSSGSIRFIMKQAVNNNIDRVFGRANITTLEGVSNDAIYMGANAETNIIGMDVESGWLFIANNTVGQRGIIAMDIRSDSFFDYSYIITKVMTITNATLKFIGRWRGLDNQTDGLSLSYRTSGFGSESGGWTPILAFSDLSAISMSTNQIQLKISFDSLTKEAKGLHAQLNELFIGYEGNASISENWEFSDDWSDNNTPSRCAFRLKTAYTSTVPQLFFRAYDLSDSLVTNHNTVANASNFEYSTDNGTSWLPLGTIPNVVGTLVRYTFTSPPGVDVRPGLKES